MRQKLNENPVAQIGVVAVLLIAAGFLLMTSLGGSESESSSAESGAVAGTEEAPVAGVETEAPAGIESSTAAAAAASVSAPASHPLPPEIDRAYADDDTVVLLVFRDGGIDDHLVKQSTEILQRMSKVAFFSFPASEIARYSQLTGPLGVSQAPALIVVRPRSLNGGGAAPASVDYGFNTAADVRQAVIDAGYHGPELSYAPH